MKTLKQLLLGGGLLLITFSIYSISSSNNPNSLTVSIYSGTGGASTLLNGDMYTGIGEVNTGALTGIGTEWMYKNVSVSLGCGRTYYSPVVDDSIPGITSKGSSVGMKVYKSIPSSKDKFFGGINRIYTSFKEDSSDEKYNINKTALTCGYRHNFSGNLYLSSYVGMEHANSATCNGENLTYIGHSFFPCYGINVGYQFKPISLK